MILKFDGGYHGHADGLLVQAGSGPLTLGSPDSPGRPRKRRAPDALRSLQRPRRRREPPSPRTRARSPPSSSSRSPATWASCRPSQASSSDLREMTRDARRAADLRRGHHRLPRRARRRPGALRHPPGPDLPGQDHRRRAARRRLRRPRRDHAADLAARARVPGGHALG